jgi:glycosyltransferase involved in cell wall biosynthesis
MEIGGPLSGIKLSICITTRNRVSFLVETLSNLLGQATAEVEIVVLDASGDGTPQAAEALAAGTRRCPITAGK